MKRIALVAPGVVPPLTEGRKRMVTDLGNTLRARGIDVTVVDGEPAVSAASMILRTIKQVAKLCAGSAPPDALAVFPFGTFQGVRALANSWLLHRLSAIRDRTGIPVLPVFYSCAGMELSELSRRFGPALLVGRQEHSLQMIHLGIDQPQAMWEPMPGGLHRLLFLCGYQQATRRAWQDVLYERGLIDLLMAGGKLAEASIRLTVAIPFLRSVRMRNMLLKEVARHCPSMRVDIQAEVDPVSCFKSHDAFVFPYRKAHAVFIPTSLLEALSYGIPSLAADHDMYKELTVSGGQARCNLHQIGNPSDLAKKVLEMQCDYDVTIARASSVAFEVRSEWNLDICADDLLAAFDKIIQYKHEGRL